MKKGGLWDKPGKNRDIYHTCYALSGLSASLACSPCVNNVKLEPIEPIYNISLKAYVQAKEYFSKIDPMWYYTYVDKTT